MQERGRRGLHISCYLVSCVHGNDLAQKISIPVILKSSDKHTPDDPVEPKTKVKGCDRDGVEDHTGDRRTGVIMTGMGNDGKIGMKLMKRAGAETIAQDRNSCVVYGMPKEVIEAGIVDVVAPLESISREICKTLRISKGVLV